MGKKFTTFVVLLAAVLFTLPTQAQIVKKAAPTGAMKTKVVSAEQLKAGKAAYEKANDKTVGIAFRGNAAVAESSVQLTAEELKAQKAADKSVGKIFAQWDWAAHQAKYFNKKNLAQSSFKNRFSDFTLRKYNPFEGKSVKVGNVAGPRRAVTADEHGIITDPGEGETKFYTRAGTAFYLAGGSAYTEDQSGTVTILEAEGGKVYIKDPVSHYSQGTWVEGTKDGNTITVAAAQPLAWNTSYSATLSLNWGNKDGNSFARGEGDITFTVDDAAGTITLDGSSTDKIIAVFWDDDNSWNGYGDYNTIWTYDPGYEPASTDPIVLPDGAEVQNWYADGTGTTAVPTDVKVAFVGNEVYISGLTSNFPDAWIKGTLDGTTVTFSKFQFVGMYSPTMPIWAVGADSETGALQDFTMTYDSEAQTLTLDENQLLVFNGAEDRMYYLSYIESLTIYAEEPAPAQIDVLPYVNSFDTAADQKQFNIIDANEDGKTFAWYSGMARYTYSSTNQGDDWLVSPAIKLVAGKKYHFSIGAHAQSTTYPERFEVKAATENTAEALAAGTEVLPSTDVTTTGFVTYENNEFTVAESGYYYIGVHAISDANEWYLYVDDFVLEAAPITAPYVADFTTDAPFGDFSVIDNNEDGKTWAWSKSYYAYYSYSSTLAADDYLILPIQLEAGKKYDVTVNAANNGYPEKFEVKVGKEGTVDGLSTVAIAETQVTSADFTDFSGSFTTDEAGTYYVAIHATSDADKYRLKVKSLTIEVAAAGTAPAAVTDLVVTPTPDKIETTIVFNAPSVTIDGNEMTENLTKIDVLRDGVVIESVADVAPGSERTIVDNEEKGLTIGTHKYQVIPYNADGIGQKSEEVSVKIVTSINVPYTVDFKQEGVIDNFTVIDANNDGKTWKWSASNGAYNTYSSTLNADDYLVTAPINMVEGNKYDITAVMSAYSASYPEKFEVKVAAEATAEALAAANAVIPATEVVTVDPAEYTGQFTAPATGKYFVAIHAISDKDNYYLIANSLSVEGAPSESAPAAVGDFTVTAGDEGALEANLSFNIPYNAINGESLANPVDAKIYRDGVLVNTITNASLGSNQTWKDTNVENGKTYTYWVVCSDATFGDGLKSEKKSVFVGSDQLGNVPNFHVASTTANSVTFAWDAVEGINGGYINQSEVTYEVYTLVIEEFMGFQFLAEGEKVAETTDLTATVTDIPVDEGAQQYLYYGVKAIKGEEATSAEEDYTYILIGAPEELPIVEGFANSTLHYGWDTNGGLGVDTESSDGDGTALKLYNDGTSSEVYFALNKVNLKNVGNPTLIFDVKSPMITSVSGIGSVDGNSTEVLSNATVTSEYTTVKVPLTSLKNQTRFATVGIQATLPTASIEQYEDYIIIDNIRIMDLYEHDLAVSVKAPKNINAGENAPINVTVENQGEEAANGFTLVIKAGDKELFNKTVNEALPAFKKTEYDVTMETTIFDDTQDITVSAEVIYENDLNPDNNKAETIVSVKGSTLAQPENVKAEQNADETVKVSWTAPSSEAAEITDDVESYEEFDCGGLNEEVHTGNIGNWTVYDGNAAYCYGFDGITIPNLGDKNAWIVMAPASEQVSQDLSVNYPAHSGAQYFISACCAEPEGAVAATDHWLISPELTGVEQTISFFARELTTSYGAETYEVLASSTDAQPASFTKVAEGSIDVTEWTEVTAQLPAGTKFFAIRHTSTDVFGLMVDDITYLGGASEAIGFNIYINGEKIANVAGDKTEYLISPDKFVAGEQEFAVSAVYANGESKPVAVKLTVVTGIKQIADGNKTFDVYTLDGKLVRQQAKSLEGLKGVYVINGKAVMVK